MPTYNAQKMAERIARAKLAFPNAKSITAVQCPDCHGNGEHCMAGCSAHSSNWYECETCKGEGMIMQITYTPTSTEEEAGALGQVHCTGHVDYAPETPSPALLALMRGTGQNIDESTMQVYPATDELSLFKVGDKVRKVTGEYRINGEVRAVFTKADGTVRLVVEHNAEGGGSFLHIYSESNLEPRSE